MPKRVIAGQPTKLSRDIHSIEYDEVHDEITVANPFAQAILTFRGGANGEEAPIRIIQGPHTQLVDPMFGVAVDPIHDEVFVTEANSILVFTRGAQGDAAPIRVLSGPHTEFNNNARALAVDPINNVLIATGEEQNHHARILIFNRTDAGDVKPRAIIAGPQTGIVSHIMQMRTYGPKGWIVTTIRAGVNETGRSEARTVDRVTSIAVWSIHDNGDVPPRFLLGGPKSGARGGAITLNPKAKEVTIGGQDALRTYSFPEIF